MNQIILNFYYNLKKMIYKYIQWIVLIALNVKNRLRIKIQKDLLQKIKNI